jgi:hypothetical protein
VTVLVSQQDNSQPAEQKSQQEREEKPPTWFWDLLQSKPAEDWKAGLYQVWISRLGDSRVPMAAGEKGYLDMFIEPITFATVKQKYGGGKYQAVLNYRGRAETSHNFEIVGQPIYDERRERPGNSFAVQATQTAQSNDVAALAREYANLFREELQHAREGMQGGAANDATVDMLVKASEKAMSMMEKRTPEAGNPTTMMLEMVKAMKEMGVIGGQQGSVITQLVHELTPLVTLFGPFVEKFLKPPDPIAEITKYKTLIETFGGGRGGGSSRTTTEDLILKGIETLPDVIRTLQTEKHAPQPAQQIRRFPAPGPTPGSPQFAPTGAAPHPPTAASAAPLRVTPIHDAGADAPQSTDHGTQVASHDPQAAAPSNADEFHTAWVKRNIVEMFAMGQDAEKIAVFIDMQKPDLAIDIGNYDVGAILGMIGMDPILGQLTQIPFYELKIEAIRKSLIEMAAEDDDLEPEEIGAAKVN